MDIKVEEKLSTINAAVVDTDKFLVSDSGVVKYRTGAEVLSDIGGAGSLSGTTNKIAKFTSATAIGDSSITDTGALVTVGIDGGMAIGAGSDLTISISSDNVTLANVTQDKDILFTVNDGGVTKTPVTIQGNTGYVGINKTPGKALDVSGDIRSDSQLISTAAEGTAPLAITSTTLVSNLNADLIDGQHASAFSATDEKVKYAADDSAAGYLGTKTVAGTGITLAEGTGGDADKLKITNAAPMTYPGAGIALSTGSAWDTPITNNSANWNTAYGWGNHASAGYLTSVTAHNLLSSTHGDTTAASVARGSIITGQGSTPKWTALSLGTTGKVLISDGTDIGWSTSALGSAAYTASTAYDASGTGHSEASAHVSSHEGSYDHSKLHDRSHALDSTSDHSGGSLTDKYLPYYATNKLANSPIATDGTSVGIGTTNPYNKVDINGTLGMRDNDIYLRGTGGQNTDHGLGFYGTGKLWNGINVDGPVLYGYAGGILGTNQGGTKTTALYWNASGNVGIGTTSPGKTLDVVGDIRSNSQLISTVATGTAPLAVTSTTAVSNLNADYLDGQHGSYYAVAGAAPAAHQLDGALHTVSGLTTGHFLKATGATTFGFAAHGLSYGDVGAAASTHYHSSLMASDGDPNPALSVDTSGSVGIGTTNPYNKVDINGTLGMRDNDIYLRGTGGQNTDHGLGFYGTGKLWNGINVDGPVLYGYAGGILGTNQGGTKTTALYWNASGNVGIGTASPDALLTVNGIASFGDGAAATPSIAHKGDLHTGIWFPADNEIAASVNGSQKFKINSSGNVIIGTSSFSTDTYKVNVDGDIYAVSKIYSMDGFRVGTTGTSLTSGGITDSVISMTATAGTLVSVAETASLADDAEVYLDTLFGTAFDADKARGILIASTTNQTTSGAMAVGIWALYHDGVNPAVLTFGDAGNCAYTDTDGKLCVYWDASTHFRIKNRLGSAQSFSVTFIGRPK